MSMRTVRYIIKEGVVNTYKNKLMSLSSVAVVIVSLMIFGFLLLFVLNVEANLSILREQPQLEVFCQTKLDETQVQDIEKLIKNNELVESYQKVSKAQAMAKMKERLGDKASALEGYDESIFPVSFVITLKDYQQSNAAVKEFEKISGVEKVSYSQDAIDLLSKANYWVKLISSVAVIALLIVSIFIIANTIKLTIFARRKEINIMKYIGATDWFIRWPFIIEGVIIGIAGSVISFFITSYAYKVLEGKMTSDLLKLGNEFFRVVAMNSIWFEIFMFFMLIGIVVGAVGSFMSLNKHLKV
jgi:cell division transport system permease protein